MEQPGLLGPRNETIEEVAGPVGGLSYEQRDRPLWQANDDKSGRPSEMSKDVENVGPFGESGEDEDVGPFGETRDDEEVGPFGETRDEEEEIGPFGERRDDEEVGPLGELRDDGLRQDYDDGEQPKEEEEEVTEAEVRNNLVQLAKKTAGILSGLLANTGAASTSTTSSTTSSTEPGASFTSSSHTLSSTPPTTSRKRARDSKEDAKDEESPSQQKRRRMDDVLGIKRTSPSQQKRRRMDDVLGIARKDTNAASNPQSIGAAMTPDVQQSKKRTRNPEEDAMDEESPSQQKRRLMDDALGIKRTSPSQQTRRRMDDVLGIAGKDTNAASKPQSVGAAMTPDVQQSRKRARSSDDNSEESTTRPGPKRVRLFVRPRDDANDEAAPSQKEWNTAHGINSNGANIRVRGMRVYDLTGEEADFYLPTSRTSSPCRPLTEKEKEDLRVYIQDYGVQDWKVLAKSMKRPVRELQTEYLEYIMARNIQAGRRKKAGIPSAYPNLAPPRPPPPLPKSDEPTAAPDTADPAARSESTKAAAASEPTKPIAAPEPAKSNTSVMASKLRPRARTCKAKNNALGDLTYDLKAKSFPRVTKDGGMVDARGNALLGIMGKIPTSIY